MTSTNLTPEEFLTVLEQSLLVTRDSVEKVLKNLHETQPTKLRDTVILASEFIRYGYLSEWQVRQLLNGKYKGFFLRQYKILDHLGTGGMSTVYLAEHIVMHRQVAIKILPKKKTNEIYLERFVREAQAIASLDHPNIVRAYDIDVMDNIHYLVMEFFDGENLRKRLERTGTYAFDEAVKYILQGARGLAYAHKNGIIHRDVKPDNLLVNKDGKVKLLDLGLALLDESIFKTDSSINENTILGTADYLAPEQAINSHEVDARADIYGLGGTLYFCLTGHPPFPTGTVSQRLLAHQKETPKSIFIDRPEAPQDLVDICSKMMAKKADDRFASALELIQVLQDWLIEYGFAQPSDFSDFMPHQQQLMTEDDLRELEGNSSIDLDDHFSGNSSSSVMSANGSGRKSKVNLFGSSGGSTLRTIKTIHKVEKGDILLSGDSISQKIKMDPFDSILDDVVQQHSEQYKNKTKSSPAQNSSPSSNITAQKQQTPTLTQTQAQTQAPAQAPTQAPAPEQKSTATGILRNTQVTSSTKELSANSSMATNLSSKPLVTSEEVQEHWSKSIPFWFWLLFACGYIMSIFLTGILFALLSKLGT